MMHGLRLLLTLGVVLALTGVSLAQEEKKAKKARDVEAVISDVGQRTITFQYERKGKVREEVVGIDEKTDIEKEGAKLKLKGLQKEDKVVIKYEPDAYTPALSVKVVGKGEVRVSCQIICNAGDGGKWRERAGKRAEYKGKNGHSVCKKKTTICSVEAGRYLIASPDLLII